MPIFADTNLYPGVNAHLNDWLQINEGAWQTFHAEHITDLVRTVRARLPVGYTAFSEPSLQISAIRDDGGKTLARRSDPDVQVYQRANAPALSAGIPMATIAPTLQFDLQQILDDEDTLNALIIYQVGEGTPFGRPVTRIELLSPANKSGGSHYAAYTAKKLESLRSGLRLVEIDYLHLFPPTLRFLPNYKKRQDGAFPYTLIITDPRPSFDKGKVYLYGIGVLDPLPTLDIPLAGADVVPVDFGAAYRVTAENSPLLQSEVDYAVDPPAFDHYTPDDQAAIRALLTDIRQRHELT
ncbi:MAG: DUF4058 family protein [Chloroflexota bacterium]|nr:DUF4058 family protein [Chloroflexota bacterium]